MPIVLVDFKETVTLSNRRGAKSNRARRLAELLLFYCDFPQLCRACLCNAPCNCPNFSALWDRLLQATDTAMPNKHHLPAALKDWYFWAQSRFQQACCQDIRLRSALAPTTFYAMLIVPGWVQQCWHQADWRVQRKPVTASSCLRTAPSSLLAELGHFYLTLRQNLTEPLSMSPTLLMSSGLRKCPGLMLQLRRDMQVLGCRGTHLIIPTAIYGQWRS